MIGDWEVPRIERISTLDQRRLARLSVPGLAGDLHHDLGSHSVAIEIEGSLHGDTERDDFLTTVREPFLAGDPLTFVADITTATEFEQVVIEGLHVEEVERRGAARSATSFASASTSSHLSRRRSIDDLGADLDPDLDALADLGLAGLELPNLLGDIPTIGDPTPPLRDALSGVGAALDPLKAKLAELGSTFA